MQKIKAVFVDFDGTLGNDKREVSETDRNSLKQLGNAGVLRAVATGRSLWASLLVLEPDFPIDYIVFSSGSGIYDFNKKEIIHKVDLPQNKAVEIATELLNCNLDFKLIKPIPNNEYFTYYASSNPSADILFRKEKYAKFELPFVPIHEFGETGQVLAIFPPNGNTFEKLEQKFDNVSVIRATSPLDGKSIWAEFFEHGISKAYGANFICQLHSILPHETMAVGNDFNDIDLLEFTPNRFVTENAAPELKRNYTNVKSNNESGVTDAFCKAKVLHVEC